MDKVGDGDVERQTPTKIPYFRMILDQGVVTPEIIHHKYDGSGTEEDPYIISWIDNDPRNPMLFSSARKWFITMIVAIATLAVAFVSSAYSGGAKQIVMEFGVSSEVVTLGVSLFVLGFAVGPLIWAPMSELFGRQYLFIGTYAILTAFNAGAAGAQNMTTLIVLRFFAGAFGSSPLTNAGGTIADMFAANERGIAMSLFAIAPFMGPVLGPIVGGFVGENCGWRWVEAVMAIFTGVLWVAGTLLVPETYPPVLLRQRAARLSKLTGKVYLSKMDAEQGRTTAAHAFKTSLSRPWVLLFREPIVLLLSIYLAIIYGTLYMLFSAFPIVYQQERGWGQGVGGLAFLGVMVGMLLAAAYSLWDNKRYIRVAQSQPSGFAPPEARLPPTIVGGIAMPVGLFWFAWTNGTSVHWIVSIIAGAPFGFGMVLVFLGVMNYLVDAYVIFAASVLAANAVLRSLFGAAFPLFTTYMYEGLGIHWASSVPGFLALACVPFPFLFYRYGAKIRERSKYAAQADRFLKRMRGEGEDAAVDSQSSDSVADGSDTGTSLNKDAEKPSTSDEPLREQEAIDYSFEEEGQGQAAEGSRFQNIRTTQTQSILNRVQTGRSTRSVVQSIYEGNPYDIDRVNTIETFGPTRTRSRSNSAASVSAMSRFPSRK